MSMEEKINNIFSSYNKLNVPGAAVIVIKKGDIVFEKGYGLSNVV